MLKASVIITAYKRKEFIKDAVNSVINNSQKPEEIIVVKNFKDEAIDSFLEHNNILNIYTTDETLGGKISLGISQSSGDIILFLEDDDLFSIEKIKKVVENFSKYNIGFYHNSQLIFYDNPNIFDSYNSRTSLYLTSVNSKKTLRELYHKYKVGFNVSSIAISKDLALSCKDILKNVKITVDTFLFFCAVEKRVPLLVDFNKLTYYRILRTKSLSSNLNISLFKMQYEDALYFKRVFSNEVLKDIIEEMIEERKLLNDLVSMKITRKELFSALSKLSMNAITFPSKWNIFLLLVSIISIFSPKKGKEFFLKMTYSNSFSSS